MLLLNLYSDVNFYKIPPYPGTILDQPHFWTQARRIIENAIDEATQAEASISKNEK